MNPVAKTDRCWPAPRGRVLLEARGITVRVRDRHLLAGTDWQVRAGEQWAVLGPNGSGKSSLVRALAGRTPTSAGVVRRRLPGGAAAIGYVSFEVHEEIARHEMDGEVVRGFSSLPDAELTAGGLLRDPPPASAADLVERFGLAPLLARPLRALSTGEMRRLLLVRALAARPALLILDEPFDGLDADGRRMLRRTLSALAHDGLPMILVTHRLDELLPETTHVLRVRDGRVETQGTRGEVLGSEDDARRCGQPAARSPSADTSPGWGAAPRPAPATGRAAAPFHAPGEPLVEMRGVTVRYGDTVALDRLTWTLRRGERWALLGPNGAGKSTLLELISGDHLQAYANDVRLFGRRRGGAEDPVADGIDLWEIRRRVGVVSQRLQAAYRPTAGLTSREVIHSGFFDSMGLFRRPDETQRAAAEGWIGRLGLDALADRPYGRLSYGERRRVLIARALVKSPELLILDEPCEGLDAGHRRGVLELMERVGRTDGVSLLYVTHRAEELPRCLTHILRLRAGRVVGE